MIDVLPEEIRLGLKKAREIALSRDNKLCVHDGDHVYRIRRLWEDGFSLDATAGARLRGRVEIFDGVRHVYQCLVVSSRLDGEEMIFDFKWVHPVKDAPAADFVYERAKPKGLLTKA